MTVLKSPSKVAYVLSVVTLFTASTHVKAAEKRTVCKDGWVELTGQNGGVVCLKIYSRVSSWQGASDTCLKDYSSLLVLDQAYFERIGISNTDELKRQLVQLVSTEEMWTSLHVSGGKLWWYGSEPIPLSANSRDQSLWSWSSGQPDITSSQSNCVKASLRQGHDLIGISMTECGTELPFVCVSSGLSTSYKQGDECDDGWLGNPQAAQCLWTSTEELSYSDAGQLCHSMDGFLVTPHNDFKQGMLKGFLKGIRGFEDDTLLRPEVAPTLAPSTPTGQMAYIQMTEVVSPATHVTRVNYAGVGRRPEPLHERGETSVRPTTHQQTTGYSLPPSLPGQPGRGHEPSAGMERPLVIEPTVPVGGVSEPQGPPSSNTMGEEGGIECVECNDAVSEEECNARGRFVHCAGTNAVCQTELTIKRNGEYRLFKKCDHNAGCTDKRQQTYQQCSSYRGILTSVDDLICTDCCISHRCNTDVLSQHSPHIYLATVFSYFLTPVRRKRAVSNVTEIWIGLTSDGMNMEWSDGAVYDSSTSLFRTLPVGLSGCVRLLMDEDSVAWEVADCGERHRAVCEKKATFEKTAISESPSDIKTITERITTDMEAFSCDVTGYVSRDLPIIWIKDGVYIDNDVAPHGLNLNLSWGLLMKMYGEQVIGEVQGSYRCQVWDSKEACYILSEPALLTFQDILTYRVELRVHENARPGDLQSALLLQRSANELERYTESLIDLFTVSKSRIQLIPEITLKSFRSRTVYFSVYYVLPRLLPGDWDSLLRNLHLLYYRDMPGQDINTLLDYLEKTLLYEIDKTINERKRRRNRLNHSSRDGLEQLNAGDFNIKSTIACPEFTLEKDGMKIIFPRTAIGKSVSSEQICLEDGHAYGKVKCLGHFTQGAHWGEITWSMRCSPVQSSEVTRQLFELLQSDMVSPLETASLLDSLTRNPDILVYADVVYCSLILQKIANSYMPSVQVGEYLVRCTNNLMSVKKEHLNNAQVINKAPTRILRALETFTSMMDVQGESLTTLCQPNICIHVHNAETARKSEMGRGIAVNRDESEDTLSSDNVDSIPQTRGHNGRYPTLPPGAAGENPIIPGDDDEDNLPGSSGSGGPLESSEKETSSPDLSSMDTSLVLPDDVMTQMSDSMDVDPFPTLDLRDNISSEGSTDSREGTGNRDQLASKREELERTLGLFMSHRMSRLTFIVYLTSDLFVNTVARRSSEKEVQVVNSLVVASAVNGYRLRNLRNPVNSTFKLLKNISLETHKCVWWDFAAVDEAGSWSTEGCWIDRVMADTVVCACNHLTNFAVITDVEQTRISRSHKVALGIISKLGIILSITGLSMTILSFILFRKMRQARSQKVLFNLALSLLCLNLVFISGVTRTDPTTGCIAVAAMLHYFLLVSFAWMLVEAVLHYLKFVKVLDTYIEKFMLKTCLPAWGGSALVVIAVFAVDWRLYRGPQDYCWLDLPAFYYAVLLPVTMVIVVNTVLFTLVIKGITCDRPKGLTSTQSQSELVWLRVKAAVCCFVLLGITWLFGFLAISDAKLVFQYIFCVCNSCQGFLIFILHILREKTVRELWINLVCCRTNKNLKYRSTVTSHLQVGSQHSNKPGSCEQKNTSHKINTKSSAVQSEKKTAPVHTEAKRQLSESSVDEAIYKRILSVSDSINTQISDLSASSRKTSDSSDFSSSLRRSERLLSTTSIDSIPESPQATDAGGNLYQGTQGDLSEDHLHRSSELPSDSSEFNENQPDCPQTDLCTDVTCPTGQSQSSSDESNLPEPKQIPSDSSEGDVKASEKLDGKSSNRGVRPCELFV